MPNETFAEIIKRILGYDLADQSAEKIRDSGAPWLKWKEHHEEEYHGSASIPEKQWGELQFWKVHPKRSQARGSYANIEWSTITITMGKDGALAKAQDFWKKLPGALGDLIGSGAASVFSADMFALNRDVLFDAATWTHDIYAVVADESKQLQEADGGFKGAAYKEFQRHVDNANNKFLNVQQDMERWRGTLRDAVKAAYAFERAVTGVANVVANSASPLSSLARTLGNASLWFDAAKTNTGNDIYESGVGGQTNAKHGSGDGPLPPDDYYALLIDVDGHGGLDTMHEDTWPIIDHKARTIFADGIHKAAQPLFDAASRLDTALRAANAAVALYTPPPDIPQPPPEQDNSIGDLANSILNMANSFGSGLNEMAGGFNELAGGFNEIGGGLDQYGNDISGALDQYGNSLNGLGGGFNGPDTAPTGGATGTEGLLNSDGLSVPSTGGVAGTGGLPSTDSLSVPSTGGATGTDGLLNSDGLTLPSTGGATGTDGLLGAGSGLAGDTRLTDLASPGSDAAAAGAALGSLGSLGSVSSPATLDNLDKKQLRALAAGGGLDGEPITAQDRAVLADNGNPVTSGSNLGDLSADQLDILQKHGLLPQDPLTAQQQQILADNGLALPAGGGAVPKLDIPELSASSLPAETAHSAFPTGAGGTGGAGGEVGFGAGGGAAGGASLPSAGDIREPGSVAVSGKQHSVQLQGGLERGGLGSPGAAPASATSFSTGLSGLDGRQAAGGMPFMPMGGGGMGGMGGPGAGGDKERERTTWLVEDEEVWGTDPDLAPSVIGRGGGGDAPDRTHHAPNDGTFGQPERQQTRRRREG